MVQVLSLVLLSDDPLKKADDVEDDLKMKRKDDLAGL